MANAAAPTSPSEDQDTNSPTWGVVVVHGVGLLEPGATLETFVLALALNQARFPRFHGQLADAAQRRNTIGQNARWRLR
jgi:hypothetical protein